MAQHLARIHGTEEDKVCYLLSFILLISTIGDILTFSLIAN